MKDEPQTRLRPHEVPSTTVVHHYEEERTLLERWLRRGWQRGPKFWVVVVAAVAAVVVFFTFLTTWSSSAPKGAKAWIELMVAKNATDQEKVADENADSRAASWALLRAAEDRYNEGLGDLPTNREAALPLLRQALELFQRAEQEAPKNAAQKRLAAFGIARAHEARNELDSAIRQYQAVASNYPGTEEAKQAERLAKELARPESIEFYKNLYAFKPREVTLPPGGRGMFDLPTDHPPLGIPGLPSPSSSPAPGPTSTIPPATGGGELPKQVFENPPPPAPQPATGKDESAKGSKPGSGAGELPKDGSNPKPDPANKGAERSAASSEPKPKP
jgi:hypothetical protein